MSTSKITPSFVLCHGFALASSYFDDLASRLSEMGLVSRMDLGFFGEENTNPHITEYTIGIGHSLGTLILYENRHRLRLRSIISLSGFLQFCFEFNEKDFLTFQQAILKSPTISLKKFYRQAGLPQIDTPANPNKLAQYLEKMHSCRLPSRLDIPICSLGSENDNIVPKELLLANFRDTIWAPSPINHTLGLRDIDFILKSIQAYLP